MHDEIEVVDQNPLGSVVAFQVRGLGALGGQRLHHGIGDRAGLPRIRPRANEKEVGEAAGLAEIEDHELTRLLVFRGRDRALDLRGELRRFLSFLSPGHATCLPLTAAADPTRAGPAASLSKVRAVQCVAARRRVRARRWIHRRRARAGRQ